MVPQLLAEWSHIAQQGAFRRTHRDSFDRSLDLYGSWGQVLKIHFSLFCGPASLAKRQKMNFQDLTPGILILPSAAPNQDICLPVPPP
jgi:hypothetical protein